LTANHLSGGEDGCYREKIRTFVTWAEPDAKKKQHFSRFRVPFDYPVHKLEETVLPLTNGTDGKPRRCAGECDQAFGRYRPLKGAEKWSRDIMKIENLHIDI